MAARRLIAVLVVLLALSVVAAAVAPRERGTLGGEDETSSTPTTTTTQPEADAVQGASGTVEARILASADEPPEVEGSPGDQLALSVASRKTIEVAIPALGLIEDATPEAPALFDILLREEGILTITDSGAGEIVGRVVVEGPREKGANSPSPGPPSSASARSTP